MRPSYLSNVRLKGEDLVMFKSRVKCHSTENFTWASSRILWKKKRWFSISFDDRLCVSADWVMECMLFCVLPGLGCKVSTVLTLSLCMSCWLMTSSQMLEEGTRLWSW